MPLFRALPYALRSLFRAPAFALTLLFILTAGIAANTTVFTVIDQVLLFPFPYRAPEQLAMVWESNPALGEIASRRVPAAWTNFDAWRTQNHTFLAMEAIQVSLGYNLTGVKIPEYLTAAKGTPGFFSMLGVNAVLGRTFLPGDDTPGANPTVILTHAFAIKYFGDSSPLGQKLLLDGRPHTVIGVLPSEFHLPAFSEGISEYKPDVWTPLPAPSLADPPQAVKQRRFLVFARLKPGVSLLQASEDLGAIAQRRAKEDPALNRGYSVNIFSLTTENTDPDLRRALSILFAAAFALLLLACTNLAGLTFLRASARKKNFAIMAALGAQGRQLLTPILTESLILGAAAGLLGLFTAYAGVRLIAALKPSSIFAPERIMINLHSFLFAALTSLLTIFIVGALPAWFTVRKDLNPALKSTPAAVLRSPRRSVAGFALISIEVAAALTLTITAILLTRSFQQILKVDPGFHSQNILTAHLSLIPQHYAKPEEQAGFCRRLRENLLALPEVESVAFIDNMPLYAIRYTQLEIEGRPAAQANAAPTADTARVTPGFLQTMRIPLRRGRGFTDSDAQSRPSQAVILNETLARQLWPDRDPIGAPLRELIPGRPPGPWQTVIGIAADFIQFNIETPSRPEIFWPAQDFTNMTVILRSKADTPSSLGLSLQQAVAALDPDQPVADLQTLDEMVDYGISQPRFNMLLLNLFAALSIVLTLVGLYGLIGSFISARIREIGIRFAMGARRSQVCRSIFFSALPPVLAGIIGGLILSFVCKRFIADLLFRLSPSDLATYLVAPLALIAVLGITSLLATLRAARIDPAVVLRES